MTMRVPCSDSGAGLGGGTPVPVCFDAVREEDVIGPAFMLNTVGGAERLCCARVASLSPAVLSAGLRPLDLVGLPYFHHSRALRRQCHLGRLGGLNSGDGGSRRGGDGCPAHLMTTRSGHAASFSTTRPSGARTSTDAMSSRLAAVAAESRIGLPPTDRQLPICSVRPSRVRRNSV